jgi:hypothetical protein
VAIGRTETAKVVEYLKKLEVVSQVVKTCKVHRVNKFGRESVGTRPLPIFCFLQAVY